MGRGLDGKVAVVTGGAQGIGRAYCEGLAQEGARVVVADIDKARAEETASWLREHRAEALAIAVDVSQPEETERMARSTVEEFGRLDILINNAAVYQRPAISRLPFDEIPIEEWDRVMAVNVRGVFLCCRAGAPYMKEQKSGKIVNISSGTVFKGTPLFSHYVTSKAAVIGFTRSLARELGPYNINVNAIAPGLTRSMEEEGAFLEEVHRATQQTRSLQRIETPADLVGTVLFLCSSDSDFITGQTLVVDGGSVLY